MAKKNNTTAVNLLAVLFTVLVLLVAWKLILPSYTANIAKAKSLDAEITAAQAKLDSLDKARSDISSLQKAYDSISIAVPSDSNEENIIAELEAMALANGLVLPAITISEDDSSQVAAFEENDMSGASSYSTTSISISFSGEYEQITAFITAIEKSVKFMNIESLNFAYDDESGLTVSIQIEAYNIKDYVDINSDSTLSDGVVSGVYSESGTAL